MGSGQPVVFGWSCASVLTGSMEPGISPGDLVVSRAQGSYSEGDVVTYLTETGSSVTHRVVAVSDEGLLTTRGDANNADDSLQVDPANVVGAVVLVVPGAGTALGWLATPAGAASAAALVAALLFLWWAVASGGRGKEAPAPEGAGGLPAGAGDPGAPVGGAGDGLTAAEGPEGPERSGASSEGPAGPDGSGSSGGSEGSEGPGCPEGPGRSGGPEGSEGSEGSKSPAGSAGDGSREEVRTCEDR
jgi:signal peptidase I